MTVEPGQIWTINSRYYLVIERQDHGWRLWCLNDARYAWDRMQAYHCWSFVS